MTTLRLRGARHPTVSGNQIIASPHTAVSALIHLAPGPQHLAQEVTLSRTWTIVCSKKFYLTFNDVKIKYV